MWPTYATGTGTGRNRRLLKDRDGRPAMARSSSRRRKESSKKLDSSAMNATIHTNPPPPCAEEDFDNEKLPALPPSRPSTASPMPSPTLLDEKADFSNSLYRLSLPPMTPASLQPYLEDETPQPDEQLTLQDATNSSSSEDNSHALAQTQNEADSSVEPMIELSTQSPMLLEKPPSIRSSKSDLDYRLSDDPSAMKLQTFSETTRIVPSPAPYPVMPVALQVPKQALTNPMMDSYYAPHNTAPIPSYEPYVMPHRPQGGPPPEWQYRVDPQGMLPSGERLPLFLEPRQSIVPLRSTRHGYEETAIEALMLQVRKVATDIDVLRVQIKELLGNVENQAWNVRELERRLGDFRQMSSRMFDEEISASSYQNASERNVLQSKIRTLENQVQEMESTSLENHSLHAQLSAATHEISHLKEALALKAHDRKPLPDQILVKMKHHHPEEAALPKYRTLIGTEDAESSSELLQGRISQAMARQEHHYRELSSESRVRLRRTDVGERISHQE